MSLIWLTLPVYALNSAIVNLVLLTIQNPLELSCSFQSHSTPIKSPVVWCCLIICCWDANCSATLKSIHEVLFILKQSMASLSWKVNIHPSIIDTHLFLFREVSILFCFGFFFFLFSGGSDTCCRLICSSQELKEYFLNFRLLFRQVEQHQIQLFRKTFLEDNDGATSALHLLLCFKKQKGGSRQCYFEF